MKKCSVIFSLLHETCERSFAEMILPFERLGADIIAVGGEEYLKDFIIGRGHRFLKGDPKSRALRYNLGVSEAREKLIILHHPRSVLSLEGIRYLLKLEERPLWGAFTHQFDRNGLFYSFTSWYSNNVRGRVQEVFYLDHCLFYSKELLGQRPFEDLEIFEDTLFCKKMAKIMPPTLIPFPSTTSAIRFEKKGKIKQTILNSWLKIQFALGKDSREMNALYEKGLGLNTPENN